MTATQTTPARYALADVVLLRDISETYVGVIESMTTHADGMVVASVRSYDGTLYARTADDLVLADDDTAAQVWGDFRVLAQTHSELGGAVRVMSARDRARAAHFVMPADQRDAITYAGVDFALVKSTERGGVMVLTTLDGRFEIVETADGRFGVVQTTRHEHERSRRNGRHIATDDTLYGASAIIARLLGLTDAPTVAEELLADAAPDPVDVEAVNLSRLRAWMRRHGLLDVRVALTAERVIAARAADEREAYAEAANRPRFPEGTPEHDAYVAELRVELGKFARGEDPYPYDAR